LLQITVPEKCIDAWKDFTGDRGTTLLCARRVVDGWWQEASHRNAIVRGIAAISKCGAFRALRNYFPIITSEDLITADTLSPILSARSSTASLVIDDMTIKPEASSTFTWAVVAPLVTATTLPGSILRALNFIWSFLIISDRLIPPTEIKLSEPLGRVQWHRAQRQHRPWPL